MSPSTGVRAHGEGHRCNRQPAQLTAQLHHGSDHKILGKSFIFECLSFLICKMGLNCTTLYSYCIK